MKDERENKQNRAIEIQDSIRQILFYDWDAIGINDNSNLTDEYDAYIAPIYRILVGNRLQKEIISLLSSAEKQILGESKDTKERLETIAEKLLMLDVKI